VLDGEDRAVAGEELDCVLLGVPRREPHDRKVVAVGERDHAIAAPARGDTLGARARGRNCAARMRVVNSPIVHSSATCQPPLV